MIDVSRPAGPNPDDERDIVEHHVSVPVFVTISDYADAEVESVKREAIANLSDALNGMWGFIVDVSPSDCDHGYV